MDHAFQQKMRQSHDDCNSKEIAFYPLPVETLGYLHSQAVLTIKKLACQLARNTGGGEEEEVMRTRHMFPEA